jgi:hypothetical protein
MNGGGGPDTNRHLDALWINAVDAVGEQRPLQPTESG